MLLGESLPVEKEHFRRVPAGREFTDKEDVHVLKRANLCFMGSMVESGAGVAIVVNTGSRSYMGEHDKHGHTHNAQHTAAGGVSYIHVDV